MPGTGNTYGRPSPRSKRAETFADESQEAISFCAIEASAELALERWPYPSFQASPWSRGIEHYLRFITNRRLQQIGLAEAFPGADNPLPWMSEIIDLRKEKNFFETRVTEYRTGGALSWD